MAVTYAVRGTQLNAWSSKSGKFGDPYRYGSLTLPAPTADATAGVFGGSVINLGENGDQRVLYVAKDSFPRTAEISMIARIVPRAVGVFEGLLWANGTRGRMSVQVLIRNTDTLTFQFMNRSYQWAINKTTTATISRTVGVPTEICFTWDGTTNANACKVSQDGVELETFTASLANDINIETPILTEINIGDNAGANFNRSDLNELLLFDEVINHVYTPRTDFWDIPEYDGLEQPAEADVRSGTTYGANTGSLDLPDVSDVRLDTDFDGASKTGTLDLPDVSDVVNGVSFDNETKTGTRDVSSISLSNVTGSIGGRSMVGTVENG